MEIRGARESELEQVVELCCIAFNPDGHERYWQYIREDSSYRPCQTRVVVVNDKVVSTLRVWERRIRVGASVVTMGGIGGVCTHPNYRGVGYASALMRDTIDYLRTTGCDIGALFTIIPEAFYRQLGWTSLPLHGFNVSCNPVTDTANSAGQISDFNPQTDLDAVARLYDIANARQSGTLVRTRAYWDTAPARIRGVLPTITARWNRQLEGYLNYEIDGKRAEAREVAYSRDNPRVLDALASHFLRACEAEGVEEIGGRFPSQHPFVKRLITRCNSALTSTEDRAMMLYAVSPSVFLRRLVVEWESQIAGVEGAFPPLAVQLPALNNQQMVLRHNPDGTLQVVPAGTEVADFDIDLSEADFWKLLFGEIGWAQISSDATIPAEVSAFLGVLFPKRHVIFWSPDQY